MLHIGPSSSGSLFYFFGREHFYLPASSQPAIRAAFSPSSDSLLATRLPSSFPEWRKKCVLLLVFAIKNQLWETALFFRHRDGAQQIASPFLPSDYPEAVEKLEETFKRWLICAWPEVWNEEKERSRTIMYVEKETVESVPSSYSKRSKPFFVGVPSSFSQTIWPSQTYHDIAKAWSGTASQEAPPPPCTKGLLDYVGKERFSQKAFQLTAEEELQVKSELRCLVERLCMAQSTSWQVPFAVVSEEILLEKFVLMLESAAYSYLKNRCEYIRRQEIEKTLLGLAQRYTEQAKRHLLQQSYRLLSPSNLIWRGNN